MLTSHRFDRKQEILPGVRRYLKEGKRTKHQVFSLFKLVERGRECLVKKKNKCMMPIKKQESKITHFHNTIKLAIVHRLTKMSLTSFQFGKY